MITLITIAMLVAFWMFISWAAWLIEWHPYYPRDKFNWRVWFGPQVYCTWAERQRRKQ